MDDKDMRKVNLNLLPEKVGKKLYKVPGTGSWIISLFFVIGITFMIYLLAKK